MTPGPTMLDGLVTDARRESAERAAFAGPPDRAALAAAPPVRDLATALARGWSVIAECKRRSPSAGLLTTDYRPAERAAAYAAAGAAAISVLTHDAGFGGRPEDLVAVRAAVEVPVLRKDFVIEHRQVDEARAWGADAVLLIVAALDDATLPALLAHVERLGMTALVEVHDETETDRALAAGASVIGVNHRDLRTFAVDTGLTARLRPRVGGDRLLVAESGVASRADAHDLRAAGADAVLVGGLLMHTDRPGPLVAELVRPAPAVPDTRPSDLPPAPIPPRR